MASNELGVQAFGLGNNGRNDLPGLPLEVFLTEDAFPKVILLHSSRSLGLAEAVARRRDSVAVIASIHPPDEARHARCSENIEYTGQIVTLMIRVKRRQVL